MLQARLDPISLADQQFHLGQGGDPGIAFIVGEHHALAGQSSQLRFRNLHIGQSHLQTYAAQKRLRQWTTLFRGFQIRRADQRGIKHSRQARELRHCVRPGVANKSRVDYGQRQPMGCVGAVTEGGTVTISSGSTMETRG